MCLSLLALASCHKRPARKNPDNYVVESIAKDEVSNEIHQLQTISATSTADFKGRTYTMNVVRRADASLPIVTDVQGVKYYDNIITVRVSNGSREILNKEFTKHSFASYLEVDFLERSILEGLVFDKVTDDGLMFAASVSYPESDLYVPFHVIVLPNGALSIDKADMMDDYEPETEPEKN
jgi:hypothetical protein